jgi:hypothetical protein
MEELELPLDPEGFSRRECPRCGAQFEVRWGAREAAVLACAMARRVAVDPTEAGTAPIRFCPYCASPAPADRFFTPDVQRLLDAQARHLEDEVRWHRLRLRPAWTGEPAHPGPSPIAPAHGFAARPSPDDELRRIALPCCGEDQKVSGAWFGPIRCHLCGIAHLRAGPRDFGLELALLKQWTEP